jgi:hypothetical protein
LCRASVRIDRVTIPVSALSRSTCREADPENTDFLFALAEFHVKQGCLEEAGALVEQMLTVQRLNT